MLAFVGLSMLFMMFSVYFYQIFYSPNLVIKQEKARVYIPHNATIYQVLDTLIKYQYIEDRISFMFVAKLLNYHENVKPGFYLLNKKLNNLSAVRVLRSGEQTPLQITLSNARTKKDIANKLCRYLAIQPQDLLMLMNNPAVTKKYGFDTTTIACAFIPNTYEVYWTVSVEALLKRMIKEYERFWTKERKQKAIKAGFTPIEAAILASIVQAETLKSDEKRTVAGLYINRLKKNIRLAADPTVVFAVGDFTLKRVLKKHLAVQSPYNTYLHKGLPAGPINIPSPASIDAVLNYEKHNYLYMCAREDFSGYHRFAKHFTQHNINAQKYRRALNKAGIR